MADFLISVDSDGGKREPLPVTLVSQGLEVDLSGLGSGAATAPRYTYRLVSSLGTTNATLVRNSPTRVFRIIGTNNNQAARYLRLYNKSSAPVVGNDFPTLTIPIEASAPIEIDLGGHYFDIGLALAFTTGFADNDTGAISSGDITAFNITYLY